MFPRCFRANKKIRNFVPTRKEGKMVSNGKMDLIFGFSALENPHMAIFPKIENFLKIPAVGPLKV